MINNMLHLLSLDQLAHKAACDNNVLALAILDKLDEEVEEAVERATSTNDADYSYEIYDAVNTIQFLLAAEWYKVEETRRTKDQIVYMIQHLHEDTSPYNNQVKLWKYKGSDVWRLEVNAGQYGEQQESAKFSAAGFKDAQRQAVDDVISMIKTGLELNA